MDFFDNKFVNFKNYKCKILVDKKAKHIQLWNDLLGNMATATVYVPNLNDNEYAIKDYFENEGMLKALLEARIVEKPHKYYTTDFVDIPICYLVSEK